MKSRGFTIYCDDIRAEIAGKTTIVGCYNGVMQIQSIFPAQLPKLGISVHLLIAESEKDKFIRPDVFFNVYGTNEDEIFSANIDLSIIKEAASKVEVDFSNESKKNSKKKQKNDSEKFLSLNFNFIISPLVIEQEGFIRTRIKIDDDVLKAGSLRILSDNSKNPLM